MKQRCRLDKRKKGRRYYIHDDVTGKQDNLDMTDRATAIRLFHSRQEANGSDGATSLFHGSKQPRRPGRCHDFHGHHCY